MAEIFGTINNDLLFGTPEDDVIDVLEGNDDVVSAFDGNDTVFGGLGDENIFGAAGDDELNGGEGTAIYLNDGESPELIAIVKDIDPNTLDLHNCEQFQGNVPIPEVSVFAEPDTPLSELESTPGRFTFNLSEPAPEDGLTIYFRAGDDDVNPETRDVNLDLEASSNIENLNLIDISDRTSSVTIPAGETQASFVVVPFIDDLIEPDETIFVDLIPQSGYTVNAENDFADLVITEGIPQTSGTFNADNLEGTDDAEIVQGLAGDDIIDGKLGSDRLTGGVGNDLLAGGEGSDTLTGVDYLSPQLGLNEVDELRGSQDGDLFLLGQILPTNITAIFYDDDDPTTAGNNDYALIADFDIEEDKIQLVGETDDYFLAASPECLSLGTGIYLNDGESPELIAVIAGIEPNSFDLNNSSQFIFN